MSLASSKHPPHKSTEPTPRIISWPQRIWSCWSISWVRTLPFNWIHIPGWVFTPGFPLCSNSSHSGTKLSASSPCSSSSSSPTHSRPSSAVKWSKMYKSLLFQLGPSLRMVTIRLILLFSLCSPPTTHGRSLLNAGNPDAKRLYDDLLSNYNKLVRPVVNTTDPLTVRIKLKLSQLIDVNLKNQIMTTNLWVEQFWFDYKLVWDPSEYGGVQQLHVPSDHIWRPDIVLYNNADGNFEVTLATKATLSYNGLVEWKPPAIYKSSCEIDVEYFPFDEQTCVMKFGSWTYDGFQVDLRHWCEVEGTNTVPLGIDLSEFYMSVEWDILEVPAVRKTLFYTVNLIIPCMGISFLTVLTFYLPSDSGEKVTLSISILTSLYVFFLLVVEIIPPTSLVVPLLGKYLIFAMILVSIRSFRKVMLRTCMGTETSTTKEVSSFPEKKSAQLFDNGDIFRAKKSDDFCEVFSDIFPENIPGLPRHRPSLFSPRLSEDEDDLYQSDCRVHGASLLHEEEREALNPVAVDGHLSGGSSPHPPMGPGDLPPYDHSNCSTQLHKACACVNFIAEHTKAKEEATKVKEDWKYVAMVLDRLFLWIFTLAVCVGTAGIILQAPSLYDDRVPIDREISDIGIEPHLRTRKKEKIRSLSSC
ncbi:hypothetical protein TCAL_10190 [Tigriopus californicus]|uniref:Neurotransmitter-gated ion-channel ligand-binding domain-containing protein n=1 Tax=Tigriopus californicus TaxID=6832 RepID=A0A553NVK6_TIGCA|nr:hypothetical protein TCAL_10190 [Tigriopus californicus]